MEHDKQAGVGRESECSEEEDSFKEKEKKQYINTLSGRYGAGVRKKSAV